MFDGAILSQIFPNPIGFLPAAGLGAAIAVSVIVTSLVTRNSLLSRLKTEKDEIISVFSCEDKEAVELSVAMAAEAGLSDADRKLVRYAMMLHDAGKLSIPDFVLVNLPTFNDQERRESFHLFKQHPITGGKMISSLQSVLGLSNDEIKKLAWISEAKHEEWNGSGFPRHLNGEQIPFEAQLIAAADSYYNLQVSKPGHTALTKKDAIRTIVYSKAGKSLSPKAVDVLLKVLKCKHPNEFIDISLNGLSETKAEMDHATDFDKYIDRFANEELLTAINREMNPYFKQMLCVSIKAAESYFESKGMDDAIGLTLIEDPGEPNLRRFYVLLESDIESTEERDELSIEIATERGKVVRKMLESSSYTIEQKDQIRIARASIGYLAERLYPVEI